MLLILLIFGAVSSRWMVNHHARLEKLMLAAAQEPEKLCAQAMQVRADWNRDLTAVLADHQYLDRAEEAFTLLAPAANRRDWAECTRLCLEIAQIFRLLSEEHQLKWENLL